MEKRLSRLAVLVFSVVLVFIAIIANAQEQYQIQVSANYSRIDIDKDSRSFGYGASAIVFFAPVMTAEHPYAEAAFLEHIGSVFVGALNQDIKSGMLKGTGPSFTIGINYTTPDFPLAINIGYNTSKIEYDAPYGSGDSKSNGYSLSIGNYFTHTLLAGVEYSYRKSDFSFTGSPESSNKATDYGLFTKYVYELHGGNEFSFTGSLGSSKNDSSTASLTNTNVSLSADFFFSRALSAGVGIENSSGDNKFNEGTTYSTNIGYFFSPQFSVKATYDRFLNANPDFSNRKAFGVVMAARF